MPKLEKVSIEKNKEGKITYTYKKTDESGKTQIIKTVYEPTTSPERLPFALDLIQRMKSDEANQYKNKVDYWKAYQKRSLQERPDLVPYKYGHFLKLNRFKTSMFPQNE